MKRLLLILLLTALVSGLTAREEVKMGAIYSLTGANSFLGGQMRDGALLRMRELNTADNNNLFDYTLIFSDDAGVPAQTVLAYKKTTQVDKVDVVFNAWAGPGNAVAPLAAHDKILNIGIGESFNISDRELLKHLKEDGYLQKGDTTKNGENKTKTVAVEKGKSIKVIKIKRILIDNA